MQQQPPPRVWVVGGERAGKKSLVAALGATERRLERGVYDWSAAPGSAPVAVAVCGDVDAWRGECERDDVVLLVFDMAEKRTFTEIATNWVKLVSAQNRTVLVATKLDRTPERQVEQAEAMELAVVECDEYVEVCALRPPFEGVAYVRQLLAAWIAQEEQRSPARQKHCVRSSVWLYDPTEAVDVAGPDDVKLRPISRALFEMREAGADRMKSHERRREHSAAKLVTRSRYHGPTESSRSMRWQTHQLQQQQQNARISQRRQSTTDIDIHHEHAKLESKSFMQTTKLMKQRVDEIKHNIMAAAARPVRHPMAGDVKSRKEKPRPRSMSTAPPPVAALPIHRSRPRAPSLSPSKPSSRLSHFSEIESEESALNFPVTGQAVAHCAPISPVDFSAVEPEATSVSPVATKEPQKESKARSPPTSPVDKVKQDSDHEHNNHSDDNAFSAEIDDMLDYFDGVTLPI